MHSGQQQKAYLDGEKYTIIARLFGNQTER